MNLRPVRTAADHAAALAEIERLWGAEEGTQDDDTLAVLAILVEDYESQLWPVGVSTPLEILRYAISEMGHSQAEFAALIGSRSRASEILSGRRRLTLNMIRKLSTAWKLPAELLVRSYELAA